MNFKTWLNTFVDEKQLDRDQVIAVQGPVYGTNYIPLNALLETILNAPKHEQKGIKDMLVRIDFVNGDSNCVGLLWEYNGSPYYKPEDFYIGE